MSENTRNIETLKEEYSKLCLKAGHLGYQIHALTKDLELVHSTLRDLNLEAAEAAKPAEEAKKA